MQHARIVLILATDFILIFLYNIIEKKKKTRKKEKLRWGNLHHKSNGSHAALN